MQVHYLEIVTPEVDATCATYARLHGVKFGKGDPGLGNARTAAIANGGMIGVRAPMHARNASTSTWGFKRLAESSSIESLSQQRPKQRSPKQ